MDQKPRGKPRWRDLIRGAFGRAPDPWSGWAPPAETASGDYGLRHQRPFDLASEAGPLGPTTSAAASSPSPALRRVETSEARSERLRLRGLSPRARRQSIDLYPLTRNSRFAQISTSPRKRGEVKKAQVPRVILCKLASKSRDKPGHISTLAGNMRPEVMRRFVSLETTRSH